MVRFTFQFRVFVLWCVSMQDREKLLYSLHKASRLASEILELCRCARKQTRNEVLFLDFLHNEVLLLNLVNELERTIQSKTIGMSRDLEAKILKCAKECFPNKYYAKFVKRWKRL
jgi:hypothetical protein